MLIDFLIRGRVSQQMIKSLKGGTPETVKLARMNLAVNGLRGEMKPANSYYEDPYNSYEKFDFVMANPHSM